jgi:type II secretory pathway component GspD/PulD (secretin)
MTHTTRCIIAWVAVSFIAIFAGAAAAPDQSSIQREYDIRDQLRDLGVAVNVTIDPTTRPVRTVIEPQPTRQQLVDQVEQWLRDSTAEPGSDIQITESKGTIQVTATPSQHDRIARLLADRVARRARTVTVECRIITLTTRPADLVGTELGEKISQATAPGGAAIPASDAEVAQIIHATQAERSNSLMTAPRLTLFDGQSATVFVGTNTSYVSAVTVSGNEDGKSGLTPTVSTVFCGLQCKAKPALSDDGSRIALDVSVTLTQLKDLKSVALADAPAGAPAKIQVPDTAVLNADHLLTLNSGQTVIVGPSFASGQRSQMLLLIRATTPGTSEPIKPLPTLP